MFALNVAILSALALASNVAAAAVPAGSAVHFLFSQNPTLAFAPGSADTGASLAALNPGDGSSSDVTALVVVQGTGVPTQIALGDLCITANGVVPGSSSQTLFVADCDSSDPAQFWNVNEEPATVSNADGNCITLGRAAKNVPVTLAACTDALQSRQLWIPTPISA